MRSKLAAAVRKNTACNHMPMHKEAIGMERAFRSSLEGAAKGSALFHAITNAVIALPGHRKQPMQITDEEYESFVTGESRAD